MDNKHLKQLEMFDIAGEPLFKVKVTVPSGFLTPEDVFGTVKDLIASKQLMYEQFGPISGLAVGPSEGDALTKIGFEEIQEKILGYKIKAPTYKMGPPFEISEDLKNYHGIGITSTNVKEKLGEPMVGSGVMFGNKWGLPIDQIVAEQPMVGSGFQIVSNKFMPENMVGMSMGCTVPSDIPPSGFNVSAKADELLGKIQVTSSELEEDGSLTLEMTLTPAYPLNKVDVTFDLLGGLDEEED